MGTPSFACPSLELLIADSNHEVVAIFTQRPKPKNRGMKLQYSPVHEIAIKNNITTYTPSSIKTEEAFNLINNIEADIIVVVAYGFIITSNILNSKKYGCLNVHPSTLPRHRGAAPLQRTIIEGDISTSVIIMQMDEGCDTGDIILEEKFLLEKNMKLQELHDKCANIGANLLIKTLNNIDTLPRTAQTNIGVTIASKLKKQDGKIDWTQDAYKIDCKIRGMNPWPGTYFEYNNVNIKIIEAYYTEIEHYFPYGYVISAKDTIEIACKSGTIIITKLQQAGKKILNSHDFLRGFNINVGTIV